MDAGTKILNALSEDITDAMTAGQMAEATGLNISTVNANVTKLLERRYIQVSGEIPTAGRYAKQYSLSDRGVTLVESGNADLIITNASLAYIPEQLINHLEEVMESFLSGMLLRMEKMFTDLDAREIEIKAMNAESLALARTQAIEVRLIQTTAVADKPVAKKDEDPVWTLSSYMNGEDITPIVDKIKSEKIKDRWVANRLQEFNVTRTEDFPPEVFKKATEIVLAAMAKHSWE